MVWGCVSGRVPARHPVGTGRHAGAGAATGSVLRKKPRLHRVCSGVRGKIFHCFFAAVRGIFVRLLRLRRRAAGGSVCCARRVFGLLRGVNSRCKRCDGCGAISTWHCDFRHNHAVSLSMAGRTLCKAGSRAFPRNTRLSHAGDACRSTAACHPFCGRRRAVSRFQCCRSSRSSSPGSGTERFSSIYFCFASGEAATACLSCSRLIWV